MLKRMKKSGVLCPLCDWKSGKVDVVSADCTIWRHMTDRHFTKEWMEAWRRDGGHTHIQCACGWSSKENHKGLLLLVTLLYDHFCWMDKQESMDHRLLFAMGIIPKIYTPIEQAL